MTDTDDELEKHGRRFDELEKKLAEHIGKCEVCQGDEPCAVGEGIAKQMDEASDRIIEIYEAEEKQRGTPGSRNAERKERGARNADRGTAGKRNDGRRRK